MTDVGDTDPRRSRPGRRPRPVHHRGDPLVRRAAGGGPPGLERWPPPHPRRPLGHRRQPRLARVRHHLGARFDGHPWTQSSPSRWSTRPPLHRPPRRPLALARRGLPLRRPPPRRPRPAAPGRGQLDMSVPGRGSPTAASPWPGPSRTAPPAPSTPHWVTSPAPGRHRPTSATWPVASPGSRGPPNLTRTPGSSSVGPLPDVMAAAVYQSPGVVTVEERTVPQPGPDQLVVRVHACGICGSDIHQLRDGWGFTPGAVAGHEWSGTIAAIGDEVTGWSVGERVVGGASPRCGTCRGCRAGKPSQCENRNSMTSETHRRSLRGIHPLPGRRCPAAPRGPVPPPCRTGRTAVGGPPRHHPFGRGTGRQRHGLRGRSRSAR